MLLNNISSFNEFKKLNELNSAGQYANPIGLSQSLLGRGTIGLFKLFKKGVDIFRLEYFKRRLENELSAGVLRYYSIHLEKKASEEEGEAQESQPIQDEEDDGQEEVQEELKCVDFLKKDKYYIHFGPDVTEDDVANKMDCDKLKEHYPEIIKVLNNSINMLGELNTTKVNLKEGEPMSKDLKHRLFYYTCLYRYYNGLAIYFQKALSNCGEDVEEEKMKLLEIGKKRKLLPAHEEIKELIIDDKKLLPAHDQAQSEIIRNVGSSIVKYKKANKEIPEDDIDRLYNQLNRLDSTKFNSNQVEFLKKIYKSVDSDKIKGIIKKLLAGVAVNDDYTPNYSEFLNEMRSGEPKTGKLDSLVGYRKVLGEMDLDWSLMKGESLDDMREYFLDKEHGKQRRQGATDMVNKNAVAGVQSSVEGIIYRSEPTPSTALHPGTGGGTNSNETSLARKWRKQVNNILGNFKFFLNVDDVDPLKMDYKNNKDVKKYADKMTGEIEGLASVLEYRKYREKDEKRKDIKDCHKDDVIELLLDEDKMIRVRKIGMVDKKYVYKVINTYYKIVKKEKDTGYTINPESKIDTKLGNGFYAVGVLTNNTSSEKTTSKKIIEYDVDGGRIKNKYPLDISYWDYTTYNADFERNRNLSELKFNKVNLEAIEKEKEKKV